MLLLLVTGLAWTNWLDDNARLVTNENFKQSLTVAAVARGFNSLISVAQGTEVAIQPVGVGVTLTLGEVLDPVNDLVERFSMLALIASVSLGVQLFSIDILGSIWISSVLTALVVVYLAISWLQLAKPNATLVQPTPIKHLGSTLFVVLLIRFVVVAMLLFTHLVDQTFLHGRQAQAIEALSQTTAQAKELSQSQAQLATQSTSELSLLDKTKALWADTQKQFDVENELKALQQSVEAGVEHIINLIVIFVLQTLLLPLAGAWLVWKIMQNVWRYV